MAGAETGAGDSKGTTGTGLKGGMGTVTALHATTTTGMTGMVLVDTTATATRTSAITTTTAAVAGTITGTITGGISGTTIGLEGHRWITIVRPLLTARLLLPTALPIPHQRAGACHLHFLRGLHPRGRNRALLPLHRERTR